MCMLGVVMKKWSKILVFPLLVLVSLMAGCSSTNLPTTNTVTVKGDVWFRERIALPPNAVLNVQLQDVSRADAPAIVIAKKQMTDVMTPMAFSFVVDENKLNPRHTYTIGAKIMVDGQLMFINTQAYRVDLQSDKPMSVMLHKVGH